MPILLVAMSLFYTGGMYLNDAFDREFDARSRPERPIPAGQVSAQAVFTSRIRYARGGIGVTGNGRLRSPGWNGIASTGGGRTAGRGHCFVQLASQGKSTKPVF
jgi:hypothetical protein